MASTVYIKTSLSSKVHKHNVTVGDVAKIYSSDNTLTNKIKPLNIYTFKDEKNNRIIFSTMKLIEIIVNKFPNIDISPIGETDFVIEYEPAKKKNKIVDNLKVALCCILIFFGAAFTIMTFNTEVTITNLFQHIYTDITGKAHDGVTILEISYSIGIGLGIIIFYNHFGKKRLSKDPTPLELEMRTYETDIHQALVDGVSRKDEHIDVE